jgi:succinyl-CoA synthetase beta subunit
VRNGPHFDAFILLLCFLSTNLYYNLDAQCGSINSLAETVDNKFVAIDAKLNFDDNVVFRF